MPRYVRARRTRSNDDGYGFFPQDRTITVHASEPVDTGLLFPDGEPVVRVSDPIGFTTLKEEG